MSSTWELDCISRKPLRHTKSSHRSLSRSTKRVTLTAHFVLDWGVKGMIFKITMRSFQMWCRLTSIACKRLPTRSMRGAPRLPKITSKTLWRQVLPDSNWLLIELAPNVRLHWDIPFVFFSLYKTQMTWPAPLFCWSTQSTSAATGPSHSMRRRLCRRTSFLHRKRRWPCHSWNEPMTFTTHIQRIWMLKFFASPTKFVLLYSLGIQSCFQAEQLLISIICRVFLPHCRAWSSPCILYCR